MIPDNLKEKIMIYTKEEQKEIEKGYKSNRKTTIRINSLKVDQTSLKNILDKLNIKYETISWYKDALILKDITLKEIRELDIYKDGYIYLQSLSSMLPPLFLNPKENEQILDMTASPGSKTTQIAALCSNNVMICACEKDKIRCARLKYNIQKQGAKKINVLQIDSLKLDDNFKFDKILLDAPCTGSGTFNTTTNKWNEKLLKVLPDIQYSLLKKAISLVKDDGEIIYSTCSILKEENENIVRRIIKEYPSIEIISLEPFKDLPLLNSEIKGVITLCPTELYEGFFLAKLHKRKI